MVNVDLLLLVAFGILLFLFLYTRKKNLHIEKFLFPLFYLVLYKTKIGLPSMNRLAKKYPKPISILGKIGIVLGFSGMAIVFYVLIRSAITIFTQPGAAAGVDILLPGRTIPGLPPLSFWHWIIALFILAVIHEFSHGVVALVHDIKIKSSGFAIFGILLPILPAAFVEPDEKILQKKSRNAQLSVFSAGSFSNFLVAGLFALIFFFIFIPISNSLIETEGAKIVDVQDGFPAEDGGVEAGEVIESVNGEKVDSVEEFITTFSDIKPGDDVFLVTNVSSYALVAATHPEDITRGYLGVFLDYATAKVSSFWWVPVFFWLQLLVFWVFLINLFVGLFNLFPLAILDGGRMFYVLMLSVTQNEGRAKIIYKYVNIFGLLLLLINFWPRIVGLFSFLIGFLS